MLSTLHNKLTLHLLKLLRTSATIVCAILTLGIFSYTCNAYSETVSVNIRIAYQQSTEFNKHLIEQMKLDLTSQGYQADSYKLNADNPVSTDINSADLIISVGSKTTKQLLDAKITRPILSVLMPRHLADALYQSYPDHKHWGNLLIDQPMERQFHLITSIFGKNQKAGILLSPYTKEMKALLDMAASKTRHEIIVEHVDNTEQLMSSLDTLNQHSNVLITLPDPLIFNQNTIRGILLSSYRKKLPIIGFSRAYVKAGAIAAIYSEPTQISQQMAGIINEFMINKRFSNRNYYPDDFSIALNINVANSLGISLDNSAAIIRRIKKAEQ